MLRDGLLIIIAALLLSSAPALAGSGAEAADAAGGAEDAADARGLEQRLRELDGVTAGFTQQISDARGVLVEESSGRIHLAKPNFRWEVAEPFPQTIIAKGPQLQIYDPDLEQLTLKQLDGSADLQDVPLTLLTRRDINLSNDFTVTAAHTPGQTHYFLIPRGLDALFASMELVFRADTLHTLIITDHTGQQSVIRFTGFSAGQMIESTMFELDLPADIDIVRG